MHFEPSLHERDIPAAMTRVFRIAPYKLWKRRWDGWADQEKANPFLTDYLNDQFRIERSFRVAYDYYLARHKVPQLDLLGYELFSFLGLLVGVHQRLSEKGQQRLAGAVRDALCNNSGLVPVEVELRTAAHLMCNGFNVEFTDLEARERFDLLATKPGAEIEIDCKSVSGDVGRSIHVRRFREFAGHLFLHIQKLVRNGGGSLLHITIPRNLHGDTRNLAAEVSSAIDEAIIHGNPQECSHDHGTIRINAFGLPGSPFSQRRIATEADLSAFLTQTLGLRENLNALSQYVPGVGAVIMVIESQKPDRVVSGIYQQLKDSAGRQFSGQRPAVLCVRLRDITAGQLENLATERQNGLAMIATRLLRADHRSHLAGISYVSPSGTLSRSAPNALRNQGYAYYFPNLNNRSEAIEQLFGHSTNDLL